MLIVRWGLLVVTVITTGAKAESCDVAERARKSAYRGRRNERTGQTQPA